METIFPFFFVAIPVVAVLSLVVASWRDRRRQRALQRWALASGWGYVAADPTLVHLQRGHPFGIGRQRMATEVLHGTFDGLPALSFRYQWTTGSGKSRSTSFAHVVAVGLPAYLPRLEVTPEGVGARLAKLVGAQDIQFESEEFNRAFRVEAGDLAFAHAVLAPRLMERLIRPDAARRPWRIEGTWVASWQPGGTVVETLGDRLAILVAVVRAIPRHVWQDHGWDPGA